MYLKKSEKLAEYSYDNSPLPIGHGQTISQPSTIAFMLDQLELKDNLKILEIGSGSGYVLALMNEISKDSRIIGIERIKGLADDSRKLLEKNSNIHIINTNAFNGYEKNAPYDRILVSAAAEYINKNILDQLADNGIAVMPINNSIFKVTRINNQFHQTEYPGFVFVRLIE